MSIQKNSERKINRLYDIVEIDKRDSKWCESYVFNLVWLKLREMILTHFLNTIFNPLYVIGLCFKKSNTFEPHF